MSNSFKYYKNIFLATLALSVASIYLYYWRFGLNADYAMIGLFAKRILMTGEQFIFVPNAGYQGLLYEGNLAALMFRLFGISPRVLNLAPFLTYLMFLFVFYRTVRAWHSSFVASIATLSLILSIPSFCIVVLRTQPNYGETYLLGSALIWLYRHILIESNGKNLEENQPLQNSRNSHLLGLYGVFGLTLGFGLYTYGQIIYFMGAVLLHASYFLILDFQMRRRCQDPQVKPYVKTIRFLLLYALLGFVLFLTSFDELKLGGRRISWMPFGLIEFGLAGSVIVLWISECRRHWNFFRHYWAHFGLFIAGFLTGYFPKLYYNLILHIPSKGGGLGRGGSLYEIMSRIKFLVLGQFQIMGSPESLVLTTLAFGITGVFTFNFVRTEAKKGITLYQEINLTENILDKMLSISPFFFLIWVILLSYLSSTSVTDLLTVRYTLALFLPFAVGIGYCLEVLQKQNTSPSLRRFASAAFGLLLLLNIQTNYQALKHANEPDVLENVAKYLTEKDVHHGYGFYWYTYPINLLTNESVILDPLGTNYTPFYRKQVQAAKRIAYVDKQPYILGEHIQINQNIKIFDHNYRIVEKKFFNSLDVFILEKT